MTNIPHVLYNTIGTDFEKYLQPKEMLTLSKVSKTTREGELTTKFRLLLDATMKEYKIFKKNNHESFNDLDSFFAYIPLGVIYRNYKIPLGSNIMELLDYLDVYYFVKELVWIELATVDDYKRYLDERDNYSNELMEDLASQASRRLRPDIVKCIYEHPKYKTDHEYYDYSISLANYSYYPITRELRALYIAYHPDEIEACKESENIMTDDEYALTNCDYQLERLISLSVCFQDQDSFREYYKEYRGEVPDTINKILDRIDLKYNIL